MRVSVARLGGHTSNRRRARLAAERLSVSPRCIVACKRTCASRVGVQAAFDVGHPEREVVGLVPLFKELAEVRDLELLVVSLADQAPIILASSAGLHTQSGIAKE